MAENNGYPRLEVISGTLEGQALPLKEGEQLLGRSRRHAQIHLEDTSVSRVHLKVTVNGSQITAQDMGSRNGTFINGKKCVKGQEISLKHLDRIKLGIYLLRFAQQPLTPEEETLSAQTSESKGGLDPMGKTEIMSFSETFVPPPHDVSLPPGGQSPLKDQPAEPVAEGSEEEKLASLIPQLSESPEDMPLGVSLKFVFIAICLLSVLGGVFYLVSSQQHAQPPSPPPVVEKPVVKEQKTPPSAKKKEEIQEEVKVAPPPPPPPAEKTIPVFLDVDAKPLSATLIFNDKILGHTPLKPQLDLVPGKTVELLAEFDLRDLKDKYQMKQRIQAKVGQEVIPVSFDGEIGMIKILKLPRGAGFYMEGYYAYDKYQAHPVKLEEIVYGKPVYVPYGHYTIELKEDVQVGEGNSMVKELRYHREFDINKDSATLELSLDDEDLKVFPAQVKTQPSGAELFIDDKKMGVTPFKGLLPVGQHKMKLVREGYFDTDTDLNIRYNVPFETTITLKTSKVGELINKARDLRRAGLYGDAINILVEALKLGASPLETGNIHLLLGECFFMQRNFEQAQVYYTQAKGHPETLYQADVGLARVLTIKGDKPQALKYLIEVLINRPYTDALYQEAKGLFKQISPMKSVLYVNSKPDGADVVVNGRPLDQKTPVVLSDLSLGNFQISVQKDGYQPAMVKRNLSISEFLPILVELKPIP